MDINMIGICKAFGTNKVLGGVNLHIRPGEVHALMGENGAGKSTLMNILTGIHKADAGTILVDGKEVTFRNNKDAEEHGIAFIHQELNSAVKWASRCRSMRSQGNALSVSSR